ncbi:MAG: hypothetical protein ACR2HJ_05865 [Fimbriimonadales bacterium]
MNCGAALDDAGSFRGRRAFWLIAGLAALLMIATIGAVRSLLIGAEGQKHRALAVPAIGSPNAIALPQRAAPPTVAAVSERMPEDVRKWLEHMKRVDEKRERFNSDFAQTLLKSIAKLRPGAFIEESEANADQARRSGEAGQVVASVDTFFSDLTREFQSLAPPAECRPIAEKYSSVLLETRNILTEVISGINSGDTASLEKLQGTSYKRIDAGAAETNDRIGALCSKYREPNRYSVFVDKGNGLGVSAAANMLPDSTAINDMMKRMLDEEFSN